MSLFSIFLDDAAEMKWSVWNSQGRGNHEAILSSPVSEKAPLAWAKIVLPDPWLVNLDDVTFVTSIRCRPLPLMHWHEPFTYVLGIPDAFAVFVQELGIHIEVGLAASVGARLRSRNGITELVNIEGYEKIPKSQTVKSFDTYALSAKKGFSDIEMAAEWIGLMCDYALHIDGYESAVAALTKDEHAT
ncbi:MAG: hypothetical protein ACRD3O_11920 [Terriglobia bacterium]